MNTLRALRIFSIIIFVALSQVVAKNGHNSTWPDILKRDLLVNYDKFVRPTHHENITTVDLGFSIKHVEIDELKGLMALYGWLKMEWIDDKLKWNTSDYGGLKQLRLADHEIWQPDLTLYNTATGNSLDHFGNTLSIAFSNGKILWVPPFKFEAFCEFNMHYWPNDEHTCSYTIGSWTYDGFQIDLNLNSSDTEIEQFIENPEWKILNVSVTKSIVIYKCCEEPYVDVKLNVTVARSSPIYRAVVKTPALSIIFMTLSCFWLHPKSNEKITLSAVNVIVICIFIMYFANKLPVMAVSAPQIVLFYSSCLHLVAFSVIISVLVLYLATARHTRRLPNLIRNILDDWLQKILFLPKLTYEKNNTSNQHEEELRDQSFDDHQTGHDDHQILNYSSKISLEQEWINFAMAIDRIFFIVYCFLFVILSYLYYI